MGRRWRGAMSPLQGDLAGSTPNVSKNPKYTNYYMEIERIRYIYEIKNLVNGKTYIGQHTLREGRSFETDIYYGSGKLINAAQRKYGLENFEKTIIISGFFTKEQLNRFERCMIACQRLIGKAEYNLSDGGDGGDLSEFIDYTTPKRSKISSENAKKMNKTLKDKGFIRKKVGFIGKRHSEESKKKMSDANKENHRGPKNSQFGTHWYTNGEINIKAKECPEGYMSGRI